MRRLIIVALLGAIGLVASVQAADVPAAKAAAAAPAAKSPANRMDPAKGAFHKKHTQQLKLGCNTCHDGSKPDGLVVKAGGGPAPINRDACLSCHQAPSKPTWYGAAK
jgi:heterodisulfide reductase subunit A-like polyferredoxin